MRLSEFDYHLPEERIAQTPLEKRDESKLMVLDKDNKTREDKIFKDIESEL
jgi:S-adenosylmethionine:tRNA ribosyltransferase-isomerase